MSEGIGEEDNFDDWFMKDRNEKEKKKCEKTLKLLFDHSPAVKFMLESLEKAGCPFKKEHLVCQPCKIENKITGGFHDKSLFLFFSIFYPMLLFFFKKKEE